MKKLFFIVLLSPLALAQTTVSVRTIEDAKNSIEVDSDDQIQLVGDSASPGNSKLYGTNGAGVKGWYDQPAGGGGSEVNDLSSVVTWTNIPDANVPESAVTQHQSSLSIAETQVPDGSLLARNAGTETITGSWTWQTDLTIENTYGVVIEGAASESLKLYNDTSSGNAWTFEGSGGTREVVFTGIAQASFNDVRFGEVQGSGNDISLFQANDHLKLAAGNNDNMAFFEGASPAVLFDYLGTGRVRLELNTDASDADGSSAARTLHIRGDTDEPFAISSAGSDDFALFNVDLSGNVTVGGTVDSRDLATDGAKLDLIEAQADVTDETNVTDALDGATLTDVGTPASGDLIMLQDASDSNALKVAQFSTFGGGGGGGTTVSFFQVKDDGSTGQLTTGSATDLTGIWTTPELTDSDFSWNGTTGVLTLNAAGTLELNINVCSYNNANNRHELHVQIQENTGSWATVQEASNYASRNNTQDEGCVSIPGWLRDVASGDDFKLRIFDIGSAATVGASNVAGETYISAKLYN